MSSSSESDSRSDTDSVSSTLDDVSSREDDEALFHLDDISSNHQGNEKYNKFLHLLTHLQRQYEVTCLEDRNKFSYPPFNLGVRSQCKFLIANYPNVKWNVETIPHDLCGIIRDVLDTVDIQLMRSITFPFLCEAKKKAESGKLQQIYNLLVLTIVECGDCIDMINTGRVNKDYLPIVNKNSNSLLDLQRLFQHFYTLHDTLRNDQTPV